MTVKMCCNNSKNASIKMLSKNRGRIEVCFSVNGHVCSKIGVLVWVFSCVFGLSCRCKILGVSRTIIRSLVHFYRDMGIICIRL